MLINYVPGEECRVAVLEDGRLEEYHTERAGAVTFVGNVYVGRVTNVEPSIQAAFVDFGLEANGFLHVSDIHPRYFPGADEDTAETIGKKTPRRERPPIQACLRRGQEVMVQVLKEGINTKGPTLTSYISIPGRYLVMLPDMDRVGVSRKVEDDEQRREMKAVLDELELPEGFGFIMRTAGEGRGKVDLKRDLAYLQRLWKDIERRRKGGDKPRLLYAESDLLMRALRDIWTSDISEIIIDNEAALQRAARFMKIVAPRSGTRLLNYDRTTPLFHAFGVEEQVSRIYEREVPLPSGGSLVIDETEAVIAIDVNSGKMRSHGDAETTAYRTNIEAVDEITRQLRLRDVGGIVLCDLIDMSSRTHRRDIENQMRDRLKRDRAATKVLPISQFGIIEMTRQRQKQSLRNTHFAACPICTGRGMLKRPDSVADDSMRELACLLDQQKVVKVEMVVSPRVAGALLTHKRLSLARLERQTHKQVHVRVSEDIPVDRVSFYAYDESGADIDVPRLPASKPPRDLPEWAVDSGEQAEWTVDTAREPGPAPEPGTEELPAASQIDDLLLSEPLDEEDPAAAPGVQPTTRTQDDLEARPGRRRRRRRGRGGRAGEAQPPQRGEAPSHGAPARPHHVDRHAEAAPMHGPSPDAQPPMAGEDGPGRKRRRRRRRGRRDDQGPEAPIGPGAPIAAPGEPMPSRGDSWDLPRSALSPAHAPGPADHVMAHDSGASHRPDFDEDDDAAPDGAANQTYADPSGAQGAHAPSAPGAEGGRRKRRRRRGGRGRGRGRQDEPGGHERDGRPQSADSPPPRPQRAPAPPAPAPRAAPAPKAPAAPAPPPGIVAPARTLYGNRRRLKPTETKVIKTTRED